MKIQAWENHEKRKAEMEMKKMEVRLSNGTITLVQSEFWFGIFWFSIKKQNI